MRGLVLALAGGADWIPAMAGALHPPCRRKKLRPLRPRLAARTAFCSVPSSSPHRNRYAGLRRGPRFFLPEENETAPAGACRRPTAAKRRLLGRRQTGRARSKREKEVSPLRGTRDGGALGVPPFFTHVFRPRRGAGGGLGGQRMDCPVLLAAANLAVDCGACPLVRPFPQGLPFSP